MPDRESTLKGLSEVSGYLLAKMDIAGVGKGKEVFGFWYRSVEDALALMKEQDKQIDDLKAELAKTEDNFSEYVETMQEKQEPVEPKNGKCPECGYTVHRINYDGLYNGIRHEWFRFCPSCGRAVKWDADKRV